MAALVLVVAPLVRVVAPLIQNACPFKGRASTESSFLGFGTGPGSGQVQNGQFLKAGLLQNRHVRPLVRVQNLLFFSFVFGAGLRLGKFKTAQRSCHVTSRRVMSGT